MKKSGPSTWRVLRWVARGKSVTRALMNAELEALAPLRGRVVDLGGGGKPSYLDILRIDGAFLNMDMLLEVRPSFLGNLERDLPLRDGSVDVILLFNALEHVFDFQRVADEMGRTVRSGGRAIVFVPFMTSYHTHQGHDFFVDDFFRYTRSALTRIFSAAGFQQVEVRATGGLFLVIADLLSIGFKYRPVAVTIVAICSALEKILTSRRRFHSVDKFPLGYLVQVVR